MTESNGFEWQLRPLSNDDFSEAVALFEARADALQSPTRTTQDGWRRWWEEQAPSLAEDNLVAQDGAGRLIGLASLQPATEPYVIAFGSVSVLPEHWNRVELWDALCAWLVERGAERVGLAPLDAEVVLMAEAVEADVRRRDALLRAGLERTRTFYRMGINLRASPSPATPPAGVTVRPAGMEIEGLAVAAAHAQAFRDHWGYAEQSPEAFLEEWRLDTAGQRTDFNFVAEAGGAIVGYVLCEDNYRGDASTAFVEYLGVLPAWRKRGVAHALLATAFQAMRGAGYQAARLGVDASSPTGALRLYERVGMHVVEQVNRYERVLRPGTDLRSRTGS